MTKALITGAAGYVGGRLVQSLTGAGWEVHALARESADRLHVPQTVCDLANADAVPALARACEGVDTVVHLAGENESLAARQPAAALAGTLVSTERVSEACATAGVKRLIYMSTVHVYGARMTPGATLTEDMRVEPRSAYAISRLASEHVAAALAGAYELVILRLTNSVGAPDAACVDRWTLVANDLCRQGALTGRLQLLSSGTQWRDFVSLSAVCSAITEACQGQDSSLAPGTYNLGSGVPRTVRDLAEMIQDTFERETGRRPPLQAPEPEVDPPGPYNVSVQRALSGGLRLDTPLQDAVTETVRFCLDHREEL
ncbi:MAG: UDP-glucose 4-epimerase [Solirubrobacteraceae bacterium]|nr:UDP-glucose 4-epimerase [Solirubrobacteraceae bacterium]